MQQFSGVDFKRKLQRKENFNGNDLFPTKANNPLLIQSTGIGLLAGVLAGLFGVGGGIVMVPLQMLFLKETIKDAVRTSLGAVCLIAIAAVSQHAANGNVLWQTGLFLGLGTLAGAQGGARLLIKLPEGLIRLLFRGLLAFMASLMVYKAWHV